MLSWTVWWTKLVQRFCVCVRTTQGNAKALSIAQTTALPTCDGATGEEQYWHIYCKPSEEISTPRKRENDMKTRQDWPFNLQRLSLFNQRIFFNDNSMTISSEVSVVPCNPTVTCLDVYSCVYYVTPHNVVGEIRFHNVEIGIYGDLNQRSTYQLVLQVF